MMIRWLVFTTDEGGAVALTGDGIVVYSHSANPRLSDMEMFHTKENSRVETMEDRRE